MCLKKHHRAQDLEEKRVFNLWLRVGLFVPSHQNQNWASWSGSSLDKEAGFGVCALSSLWTKPS